MPTPSERLQKIIDAQVPSKIVFKAGVLDGGDVVQLNAVTVEPSHAVEILEDRELQAALAREVAEHFDQQTGTNLIKADVEHLWSSIKRTLRREYDNISPRCNATKKKTDQFIRDINITDKHLPNYLLQVFTKVRSPSYQTMSRAECEDLFEQFESLRRTYGKR